MSKCAQAEDRTGQPWTKEEDAALVAASYTRATWKNIAGRFGRSESAVVSRAKNLRQQGASVALRSRSHERRRPWTDAQRERVRSGLERNESIEEIASDVGRSRESVRSEVWRIAGARAYKRHHPNKRRLLAKEAIEMSKQGSSLPEIAEHFGVGIEAIRRWCRKLGHDPSKWTRREYTLADDDRIRAGYAAGEGYKKIAAAMGRTPASVRMRAKKLGVTKVQRVLRKPWTAAELARAVSMRESGETYKAIGEALGRSYASVKSALDQHARRR